MCWDPATGARSHEHVRQDSLNKRIVRKESLCQWLGAFSYMMSRFACPHMQMAVERLEKISNEPLQEKNKVIELQSKFIELQSKIVQNREEELTSLTAAVQKEFKSVQSLVETEMSCYFSVLSKMCAAA